MRDTHLVLASALAISACESVPVDLSGDQAPASNRSSFPCFEEDCRIDACEEPLLCPVADEEIAFCGGCEPGQTRCDESLAIGLFCLDGCWQEVFQCDFDEHCFEDFDTIRCELVDPGDDPEEPELLPCGEVECGGLRICGDPDTDCGPCGCCSANVLGTNTVCDHSVGGSRATLTYQEDAECWEREFCRDGQTCQDPEPLDPATCVDAP